MTWRVAGRRTCSAWGRTPRLWCPALSTSPTRPSQLWPAADRDRLRYPRVIQRHLTTITEEVYASRPCFRQRFSELRIDGRGSRHTERILSLDDEQHRCLEPFIDRRRKLTDVDASDLAHGLGSTDFVPHRRQELAPSVVQTFRYPRLAPR